MFCMKCGKKLPDDSKFCPFCGAPSDYGAQKGQMPRKDNGIQMNQTSWKDNGVQMNQAHRKKNLPYAKFIAIGAAALAVLIIVGVIAGRGIMNMGNNQSVASRGDANGPSGNDGGLGWLGESSEDTEYDDWSSTDDSDSGDAGLTERGDEGNENSQWAGNRSYEAAYEEEYANFESMVHEYCVQSDIEYMENIEEYADQIDEAYQLIEKAVPGFSDMLAEDIGSLADSETGSAIIEKVASAALNNEDVRKTAYKMTMIAADSLLKYLMNYVSTDDPYVFELVKMSGDYALLRSEGTYEDFYKITKQNLAYDTTMEAVQWRISQLEAEADSAESEDEYAECMGRIAANKDRAAETEELLVKGMATIACSGIYYCSAGETNSPKLYIVEGVDGTIYNTFWAPGLTEAEADEYFDITISDQGDCLLIGAEESFVMDRSGTILFEGNSPVERADEPVGESIILAYCPGQKILRETKMKNSANGVYYTLELADQNGNVQTLVENMKELDMESISYDFYVDDTRGIQWNHETAVYSDYILLSYTPVGEDEEKDIVIDLNLGQVHPQRDFQEAYTDAMSEKSEEYGQFCEQGLPQDEWRYNGSEICVYEDSVCIRESSDGLVQNRPELDTDRKGFNMDALRDTIGETREVEKWYYNDNLLWIVTSSGCFYTYDMESGQKNNEVEIGADSSYSFTPYGLLVQAGSEETDQAAVDGETEYSVDQYDAFGNVIATYPTYRSGSSEINGDVYNFLYLNGKDVYNIATQTVIRLD